MKTLRAGLDYQGERYLVTQDWDEHASYYDSPEDLPHHAWYMWVQGNYSCDCNRLLFMGLDDDAPCGEEVTLLSLTLDGKDLLAPTDAERLAEIGLVGIG